MEFIDEEEDPAVFENQIRAVAAGDQAAVPAPGGENGNPQPEQGEAAGLPADANAPNQQDQRRNNNIGIRRNVSASAVASTVMGALFLPTISSVMGDILKVTLPRDWVTKKSLRVGARGLLQEKWGRSVIGGCLFVVLKDALLLYCKWKKARDFGKKRILDYTGKRSGQASPAAD